MSGQSPPEKEGEATMVTAITDHDLDKYSLFEKVLEASGFFAVLDRKQRASGKDKADFRIAIKPNLSMMLRLSDVGTYTDPFLVIHLLRLLLARGYGNLGIVESQNLYGNWFRNRSVIQVARRAGYFGDCFADAGEVEKSRQVHVRGGGVDAHVPLIDLTMDMVAHDFGEPVGEIMLGRSWIEADFRISMCKFKTHFYSYYTLGIKNVYGCLPLQDKVRGYHCRRKVGRWTARMIQDFPVDFSIVDAVTAADGWLGVKMKAICKKPHTMIAGEDMLAVDHLGAGLMRIKPEKSVLFKHLARLKPMRPYQVTGNAEPVRGWRKCPGLFTFVCQIIEPYANIMDFAGSISTGGHDPCFPHTSLNTGIFKRMLFYVTLPVNTAMDVGWLVLARRRKIFFKKLAGLDKQTPLLSAPGFPRERLAYLSPESIAKLADLIAAGVEGEISFSGHYLFIGEREIPWAAGLSTENLAAVELIKCVHDQGLDPAAVALELRLLARSYASLFGSGNERYPYCFS